MKLKRCGSNVVSVLLFSVCLGAGATYLDTSDRSTVQSFFNTDYQSSEDAQPHWTGDASKGDFGGTSAEFKQAVARRINWFRNLAGIPGAVQFDDVLNRKAQQAALMVSSNGELNHSPPPTWINYTQEGAEAANNSNIGIGVFGPDAITAYMRDTGSFNRGVGHRLWLLLPNTTTMGTGDVPASTNLQAANACWIRGGGAVPTRPITRDGFVAWPPPGYFPYSLTSARWSFSYPDADFTEAKVSMIKGGLPVETRVEAIISNAPESALVWVPAGFAATEDATFPKSSVDCTNVVTVSNVIVEGIARTFTYDVIVFDPSPAPESVAPQISWRTVASTSSSPASTGSTLYFRTDTELVSIDANTGSFLWRNGWGSPDSTPVSGNNGLVYVGGVSPRGAVVAVNAIDGELLWYFFTGADASSAPALGSNGVLYFGTGHSLVDGQVLTDGKLYAADAKTGGKLWEFSAHGDIYSSPSIGANGRVYFGTGLRWEAGRSSLDGRLVALDGTTGREVWEFFSGGVIRNSPALGENGDVFFGTLQGRAFCLKGADGTKRWEFIAKGGLEFSSPVIDSSGTVYFGTLAGKLYALEGSTGIRKWSVDLGAKISSSPVVADENLLIIPVGGGKLYALNRLNGAVRWVFDTGGTFTTSSAVVTSEGLLAFGYGDKSLAGPGGVFTNVARGNLIAFAGIHPAPSYPGWPMVGQNQSRTGQMPPAVQPRIIHWQLLARDLSIDVSSDGRPVVRLQRSGDFVDWVDVDVREAKDGVARFLITNLSAAGTVFFRTVSP